MTTVYDKLVRCYESIADQITTVPKLALVLGSGLGDFAKEIDVEKVIEYKDIVDFPVSTVVGHKGQYIFGKVNGVPIVADRKSVV